MVWFISYADKWVAALAVVIALAILVHGFYRRDAAANQARGAEVILVCLILLAFVLPVLGYWVGGRTHPNAIGGLLPWNDAAGYFSCARGLLDGSPIASFCGRRPLYSAYLAGLLALSGRDLQLALIFQVLIVSIAAYLFAHTLAKRWGLAAATLAIAPIASYAGAYTITTLTENLGLALGTVALVFLLMGAERKQALNLVVGALLLTLALNARAGAFFVLPLLVLWPLTFVGVSRAKRWRHSGLILGAIILGFISGPILSFMLGGQFSATHANFSYTIYGIVAGGKGWLHVFSAHPELVAKGIPESTQAANIYAEAWRLFLEKPSLTLFGLVKGFLKYLEQILKYVPWLPVRIVVVLMWVTGIVTIVRKRRDPTMSLLGFLALGIALSAPILVFDGGTRIYAATIAVDSAIVAIGFVTATRMISPRLRNSVQTQYAAVSAVSFGRVSLTFAFGLILFVLVFPILLRFDVDPKSLEISATTTCQSGDKLSFARLGSESPVLKIVEPGNQKVWPVQAAADKFTSHVDRNTYRAEGFRKAKPGISYVNIYDRSSGSFGKTFVAISDGENVPSDGRIYIVCTRPWADSPLDGVRKISRIMLHTG